MNRDRKNIDWDRVKDIVKAERVQLTLLVLTVIIMTIAIVRGFDLFITAWGFLPLMVMRKLDAQQFFFPNVWWYPGKDRLPAVINYCGERRIKYKYDYENMRIGFVHSGDCLIAKLAL